MRVPLLLSVSALVAVPLAPATGQTSAGPGAAPAALQQALHRVDEARAVLAQGGAASAVRAAAVLRPGTPAVPRPPVEPAAPADLTALPPQLRAPVGALLVATLEAHAAATRDVGAATPVRAARAAGSALAVTAAVDAALPALRAAAATPTAGRPGVSGTGCDLLDQPPVVCVSGTTGTTHRGPYLLTVDLGGDDVHAGRPATATAALPVSVAVDVGGADTWTAEDPAGAAVAAADLGGVAVLVDATGDDRYTVTSTSRTTKGLGYALGGAAVLADLAGADRYTVRGAPHGGPARVEGLGYIGLGGLAVVADAAGDDDYLLHAAPQPLVEDGAVSVGSASAHGIGSGVAGSALLADAGGRDRLTVLAESGTAGADGGPADATGIGYGSIAGVGAVLLGPGSARAEVVARSSGTSSRAATARGLGWGGLAGVGVLDDAGGDDVYEAIAESRAAGAGSGTGTAGSASVSALGHASLAAVGAVRDAAGADRYTAAATSTATADDTAATGAAVARAQGSGAVNPVAGEGLGAAPRLLEDGGAGALWDLGGADRYAATATTEAVVTHGSGTAVPGVARVEAQAMAGGGGAAELRDVGGADSYWAVARAAGSAGGSTVAGTATTQAQGSGPAPGEDSVVQHGAALLLDVDGGVADAFTTVPADPTASGTRGTGVWTDAGSPAAGGVAA